MKRIFLVKVITYVKYHLGNKYPRPLNMKNGNVLAFSGAPGKVSMYSKDAELIQKEQLMEFNYSSNAAIRELDSTKGYFVCA